MGFRLKIEGQDNIEMNERQIKNVEFCSDIPMDSNAIATDNGVYVKIWGKLLFSLGAEKDDSTLNLARWSQVPSESADCYRNLEVSVISAGQVVRNIVLPNAFVMEYSESLDDESGVGEFYLHVKQKKDIVDNVSIDGGFSGE